MNRIALINQCKYVIKTYPLTRGILSYSLLWPVSSIIQQSIEGKRWGEYDWKKCLRYSIFGGLYVAPTLYCWIRVSTAMWPYTNLKAALSKSACETVSYSPMAITSFYFIMSLLEGKSTREASVEVHNKFLPTLKVGILVWPILSTINFTLIKEKNRVPFISVCSLFWSSYLAYMKQLDYESAVISLV